MRSKQALLYVAFLVSETLDTCGNVRGGAKGSYCRDVCHGETKKNLNDED